MLIELRKIGDQSKEDGKRNDASQKGGKERIITNGDFAHVPNDDRVTRQRIVAETLMHSPFPDASSFFLSTCMKRNVRH